jgi:hypothetical protein
MRSENRATLYCGRRWLNELIAQGSIAKREGCSTRKVNMTISLAFLTPDLVKAAIEGRFAHGMRVTRLRRMVSAVRDPRTTFAIRVGVEPSLCEPNLRFPGNGNLGAETQAPKAAPETELRSRGDQLPVRKPANCGHSAPAEELSTSAPLGGGAERTQTACHAPRLARWRCNRSRHWSVLCSHSFDAWRKWIEFRNGNDHVPFHASGSVNSRWARWGPPEHFPNVFHVRGAKPRIVIHD